MGTRDRAEYENQDIESRSGGGRVGEQCDGGVAACQALAHDAGADNDGQQKRRADALGRELARRAHEVALPISSSFALSFKRSSVSSRRAMNRLMRRVKTVKASRNARRISSSEPLSAAGSATPQNGRAACREEEV